MSGKARAGSEFLRAAQAGGPVHNVAVEGTGVRSTDDVVRAMTNFGDGSLCRVMTGSLHKSSAWSAALRVLAKIPSRILITATTTSPTAWRAQRPIYGSQSTTCSAVLSIS